MPAAQRFKRGRPIGLELTWTVPAPQTWSSLESLELRIRQQDDVVLALRWVERDNTLQLLGAKRSAGAVNPTSRVLLRTRRARLRVEQTTVATSGPTGQSVIIRVVVALKPRGRRGSLLVDAIAINDAGEQEVAQGVGALAFGRERAGGRRRRQ